MQKLGWTAEPELEFAVWHDLQVIHTHASASKNPDPAQQRFSNLTVHQTDLFEKLVKTDCWTLLAKFPGAWLLGIGLRICIVGKALGSAGAVWATHTVKTTALAVLISFLCKASTPTKLPDPPTAIYSLFTTLSVGEGSSCSLKVFPTR